MKDHGHEAAARPDQKSRTDPVRGVRVEDLHDLDRLGRMAERYAAAGLTPADGVDGLLHVVAAAEHALHRGTKNPAGLFAWIVRGRHWGHLTESDFDSANARFKASAERGIR